MYLSLYVRYFVLPLTVQVRAVSVVASKACMNSSVRLPYLIVKPWLTETLNVSPTLITPRTTRNLWKRYEENGERYSRNMKTKYIIPSKKLMSTSTARV